MPADDLPAYRIGCQWIGWHPTASPASVSDRLASPTHWHGLASARIVWTGIASHHPCQSIGCHAVGDRLAWHRIGSHGIRCQCPTVNPPPKQNGDSVQESPFCSEMSGGNFAGNPPLPSPSDGAKFPPSLRKPPQIASNAFFPRTHTRT